MQKVFFSILLVTVFFFSVQACQTRHQVESVHKVEVAPMHITIDVNVKIDKELDDFFGDLDEAAKEIE